jgi:hypothetical protein
MQFFKMQLFQAALPCKICNVVAQQNQTTVTVDEMYRIVTTIQRESSSKITKAVTAVEEEEADSDEENKDNLEAFQYQRTTKGAKSQSNYQTEQNKSRNLAGSNNNTNRNSKYYYYCQIQNHRQEECQKWICENKPCRDRQG